MRDEDRVFLTEYATCICYTHPFVALALHRAAVDAREVAIVTESLMRRLDRADAEVKAETDGTAALIQRHVVARLLAQLAAAIEDCGAIGDAVRYRDRKGLLRRYLNSQAGSVGDFWDLVTTPVPLTELLALPKLDDLSLSDEDRQHLESDYTGLQRFLVDAADIYRGRSTPGVWSVGGLGPASQAALVHIIVDVVSPSPSGDPPRPGVSLLEAYNKIKHRFTVFDRITDLSAAVGAVGDLVIDATYPTEPTYAERLLHNIFSVATASGEVAAIVLRLDELGVLPPGA